MKCRKCGREGAYARLRTKDVVCRMCGAVEPMEEEKKEVDKEEKKR